MVIVAAQHLRRISPCPAVFERMGSLAGLVLWAVLAFLFSGIYDRINTAVFSILFLSSSCPFLPGSDIGAFIGSLGRTGTGAAEEVPDDGRRDQHCA